MNVLAYDYPILGVFWSMVWLFLWIAWIVLLFRVIADIFRSHDMGGWGKALWAIFVVVVPFLGVFVYVIARGHSMTERDIEQARTSEAAFRSYVQDAAGSDGGTASELSKLADLKAQGVLTDAEFEAQKAKLLS
jgi:Short C-terminal domain/Phospholipase_D-nuclease N-terminal